MTRVLLSAPWTWAFGEAPESQSEGGLRVILRASDWGLPRWRARLRLVGDSLALARLSAGQDCVVLSTVGAEAALLAAMVKVRSSRTRVLVFDFLAPRHQPPAPIARRLFALVDRFLVIRSGDAEMLERRFGFPQERTTFLAWPVGIDPPETADDGYVYSAGWAHRDWDTLLAALELAGLPARLAPGRDLPIPPSCANRITVIDMPTPEAGRRLTARARVVAVAMRDTDLPSGPLVLLDALAMGKAVAATAVNGTRDYVRDGETALVVPPGDAPALARALTRLWEDAGLRQRLGEAAQAETLERCSLDRFWKDLAASCR